MKQGVVIWLTGRPGSGKTTIARSLKKRIGQEVLHLDERLAGSTEQQCQHARRIGAVARVGVRKGQCVICSCVSPYRELRDEVRAHFNEGQFIEVFVKASVEVCKARGGTESFIYEEPVDPEVIVDTENCTITKSANAVINWFIKYNLQ